MTPEPNVNDCPSFSQSLYPFSGNQVIAFANKVKNGDMEWIDYLLRNGCPKNKVQELGEVKNVIAYFNKIYVEEYWKKYLAALHST